MAKGPAAFVRDATGLVRNVSLLDAIALNISNMGGAGILAILGYTTVLLPSMAGVNLVYASIIGLVISVPQIIVYTMMTQRMPRTGGDYVWISRTFGGFVGGVGALAGFMLADIPFISLAALATVFAIGSVAVTEGFSGFMGLALPGNIPGANTVAQFLLASIIVIGLILINMLRPKLGYRIVSLLTIIGVISTVVGICSLLAAGTGGVVNYVNSLGIANTTYTSIASSYSGSTFDPAATGMVVPFFIAFGYIYLNAAPAVASEIKGKNTLRWNVPVSVGLQFLLLTAGIGAMYYAGGFNFINAAFSNATLVYNYSFNFWTLAMGVASTSVVGWIIGIGWIVWLLATVGYGVIVIPRYFFAQSFDRYLPSIFAYVNPKFSSPIAANLIDLVITMAFVASASFLYGTIVSIYGIFVAILAYFMIVGLAAAVYAARKEKGGSKMLLMVCGILMAVVFVYAIYEYLLYPNIWGGNQLAYGYDLAALVLGIIIYFASKSYHMKRGIDISLTFKEIPPE